MNKFTPAQVEDLTGASPEVLRGYRAKGYMDYGERFGASHAFEFADVFRLDAARTIADGKCSLESAFAIVNHPMFDDVIRAHQRGIGGDVASVYLATAVLGREPQRTVFGLKSVAWPRGSLDIKAIEYVMADGQPADFDAAPAVRVTITDLTLLWANLSAAAHKMERR